MKRRATLTTSVINDIFAQTDKHRKPSPYDLKYDRHTYSIKEGDHGKLKEIAAKEGVGLNDLVRYLIDKFLRGYHSGEIVLPVEEYVVTKSRLSE